MLHTTALFFLIAAWLRIGGLVSVQTKLVTEGQGSSVLAEPSLVQPVLSSLALSKFLEVAARASRSTYNSFN